MLTSFQQTAGQAEIVVHHVTAIGFHGVAASAFVEDSFYFAVSTICKEFVEKVLVDIVGNLQIGQVDKLVAMREVIDRDDVVNAACVQAFDDVAANKSCSSGDDDLHANNSS